MLSQTAPVFRRETRKQNKIEGRLRHALCKKKQADEILASFSRLQCEQVNPAEYGTFKVDPDKPAMQNSQPPFYFRLCLPPPSTCHATEEPRQSGTCGSASAHFFSFFFRWRRERRGVEGAHCLAPFVPLPSASPSPRLTSARVPGSSLGAGFKRSAWAPASSWPGELGGGELTG